MKKIQFIFVGVISLVLFSTACNQKKRLPKKLSADEILNADKTFSDLSKKEGMKRAFIDYIDNEGILLRPDHLPIVGANAIDFLSQVNDSSYTLTWNPTGGEIAASGDLGYTYGVYKLQMKDTMLNGTYVSIWKKQKDNKWKFVLDAGNQGISSAATNSEQ